MRRLVRLALSLALLSAPVALADVPLPPNLKYVTPKVRFEGVDQHTGHVFYLKYNSGQGNPFAVPPRYIQVKNSEPFEMQGGRRIVGVTLFAVPKDEAEKLKEKDPTLAWLNDKTPGILSASVTAPSTVVSRNLQEVPVTSYKIKLAEGKLSVEMVQPQKRGEAPTNDRLRVATVALALSGSLALLGLWLVRRRRPE
jgi:hypothetical protein